MMSKGPFIGQDSSRFSCLKVISALSSPDAAQKPGRPAICGNQFLTLSVATPLKRSAAYTPSVAVATTFESISVPRSLLSQLARRATASIGPTAGEEGPPPLRQPPDQR